MSGTMDRTISDSQFELLSTMAELRGSGLHADLTIKCAGKEWPVHKGVVSARSPVLCKALTENRWKEGMENQITLGNPDSSEPNNDPVAVEMMIQYIYQGDYRTGVDPYGEHTKPTETHPSSCASAIDNTNATMTPEIETGNKRQKTEDKEKIGAKVESGDSKPHIDLSNLHAKVYALGDMYLMPSLKTIALQKFESEARSLKWNAKDFCATITTVFTTTPSTDVGLRDVVAAVISTLKCADASPLLREHIDVTPGLASSLWRQSDKASVALQCWTCLTKPKRRPCLNRYAGKSCVNHIVACECSQKSQVCGGHRY